MGCCGRRSRVEDGRNKRWVEERRSYYHNKCMPPPVVICLVALGVLLAFILLALTIFFIFFWPLPQRPYSIHVANFGASQSPGGKVVVQTPPSSAGSNTQNQGSHVTQEPKTLAGDVTTLDLQKLVTLDSLVTQQNPCTDMEPFLCGLTDPATVCASTFGRAYCCDTCNVDVACRDLTSGCFQVWYYGLCVQDKYMEVCCVSCTEGGVTGPPLR